VSQGILEPLKHTCKDLELIILDEADFCLDRWSPLQYMDQYTFT